MNIVVSGSLAYDRIMDFPGYFSDHILPEKINNLNVCFPVDGMVERFGGTAGNIAYALTLMGEQPLIYAAIGRDYQQYFEWLRIKGISTDNIKIIPDEFTACAYINTDKAGNQITVFNSGAMKYSTPLDLERFKSQETLVIVSPGNYQDMVDYPRLCKEKGIDYIFDPGQSLPMLKGEDLVKAINGCLMLICNDYELGLILNKTGLPHDALLKLAETVIVTKGEKGSVVYTAEGKTNIPAVKPRKVVDPTGAGDSYRGGLLSGLVRRLGLEKSAIMGAVCSSFCLECYGTQEYSFSTEEFELRLKECSGKY
jgi:adenosine kinase